MEKYTHYIAFMFAISATLLTTTLFIIVIASAVEKISTVTTQVPCYTPDITNTNE